MMVLLIEIGGNFVCSSCVLWTGIGVKTKDIHLIVYVKLKCKQNILEKVITMVTGGPVQIVHVDISAIPVICMW